MKALSIIIPFHDSRQELENYLPDIIGNLSGNLDTEIILVNSRHRPEIAVICEKNQILYVSTKRARRSVQMNHGARKASAPRLFFLHIDSIPPQYYDQLIVNAPGNSGCFQLAFNPPHWFLDSFAFFTRYKWVFARGGDQGLYIDRGVFDNIGGFKAEWSIMEDIDICRRLSATDGFHVLPQKLITSSRKYLKNGVYKLQFIFIVLTLMYWLGFSNGNIQKAYAKWVK